ncbi:hypothetical protein LTR36_001529 [Oleoguttula mirabilis]|uniref:Uncharacterized protein n=1 Tax=Oleoguttula mirabilis TaxID=1507867 RepID=A0AAV9JML3_9PEZI|nr:hypothetical protein LTR36_001529 [Oleoguttula mirabilis]
MSDNQSKASIIEERRANLPLPEQPPVASDFNSADQSTVNVGSGGISDASDVRNDSQGVGREGTSGIPNDAVTRDAKGKKGLEDTTGKDYGYPQKSDPADSSELK